MGIFLNIVPCATYALAEYHVKALSRSIDARIGGKGPSEILESTCGVTHLRLLIRLSGVPKEKKMGISHIDMSNRALEMPQNHSF